MYNLETFAVIEENVQNLLLETW